MNRQLVFSIVFALLLIGCKKEIPAPGTPAPAVPIAQEVLPEAPKTECYSYNENGSIILLQLSHNKDNINGTLTYGLKEKDSNTGHFVGKIENNILIADYTFQSEGTESVRQVAFQFKDDKLIEGYGEMTEDGTHFKDIAKLKFDSKMPLSKTVCTE
jgi:hypothetical protein